MYSFYNILCIISYTLHFGIFSSLNQHGDRTLRVPTNTLYTMQANTVAKQATCTLQVFWYTNIDIYRYLHFKLCIVYFFGKLYIVYFYLSQALYTFSTPQIHRNCIHGNAGRLDPLKFWETPGSLGHI